MNEKEENILETMPVGKLLLRLAVPAVLGQMINILYNLVDRMFIGHIPGTGAAALAGVGTTAPVILAVSAFAALVSMGGAPKASIMLGKGRKDIAEEIMGTCTFMLIVLSVILTVGMLLWGKPVLLLFGASSDTIDYAVSYMNYYCVGTVFVQLTLGLNAFISAQGFTAVSMFNVAAGAAINVVLDPIFIYKMHMGVSGAAFATVISQAVSTILVLRFLCSERTIIRFRIKKVKFNGKILGPCIMLGASPALMQLTENMVAISFNTSLQKYGGDMAVASMSILNSVMQFVMLLLPGMVQGAQPILSYNLGAGNIERVKKAFRYLLAACVTGSFLIWVICMEWPQIIAGIFTSDQSLISYTVWSVRIYLAVLLIYGIQVACQYSFVALDNAKAAIFLTIWRKIILLIPLIFILPHFVSDPVKGVFLAEPLADTIAICTTAPMFYHFYRHLS